MTLDPVKPCPGLDSPCEGTTTGQLCRRCARLKLWQDGHYDRRKTWNAHDPDALFKTYTRCQALLPREQFRATSRTRDGLTSACKRCEAHYRRTSPKYRAKCRARKQRDRKNGRHAVREKVREAIRSGRLTKPATCELCHLHPPEAHHEDYSRPLFVRWLCRQCHRHLHRRHSSAFHALTRDLLVQYFP